CAARRPISWPACPATARRARCRWSRSSAPPPWPCSPPTCPGCPRPRSNESGCPSRYGSSRAPPCCRNAPDVLARRWGNHRPRGEPRAADKLVTVMTEPVPARVLVVDDDLTVRDVVRRYLELGGHQVSLADN